MRHAAELRGVAIEALDRYIRSGRAEDWSDAAVAAVYAHEGIAPPDEVRDAVRLREKKTAGANG